MEAKFRRYKSGDEEGIVELMKTCFRTFNSWKLSVMDWIGYEGDDDGFSRENALVAEIDGEIVGHVQLMHRKIRIGNSIIDCGGIANVSTHPKHRMKGVATKLMQMALDICREKGWPISSLFTGYGSDGYRVYRKVGYANTTFIHEYVGTCENVDNALKTLRKYDRKNGMSEMGEEDLHAVMKIHDEYGRKISGYCQRSENYWRKKIMEKTYYQSFFYEGKEAGIRIVSEDDEVNGYALSFNTLKASRSQWTDKLGMVMELGAIESGKLCNLLNGILNKMRDEGIKIFRLRIPEHEELSEALKCFETMKGAIYMNYIVNQRKLFEAIKEELEERIIEKYGELDYEISIGSPYGCTKLEISSGKINVVEGKSKNHIQVTSDGITKLIYGVEGFKEMLNDGRDIIRIEIDGEALKIFEAIFPKRIFQISPIDEW
jgi:predicted acetyltransferase